MTDTAAPENVDTACEAQEAREGLTPEQKNYRDLLEQLETQAAEAFDKTAVSLSGGALGVSIAFLKDIAPKPIPWTVLGLLGPSWVALVLSLLGVLLSQMASQKSMRHEIECLDGRRKRSPGAAAGGAWRRCTSFFNHTAWVGCVVGIGLLAVFVVVNTRSKAMAKDEKPQEQTKIDRPEMIKPFRESTETKIQRGRVTPDQPPPKKSER
jgi:hypothetical protein